MSPSGQPTDFPPQARAGERIPNQTGAAGEPEKYSSSAPPCCCIVDVEDIALMAAIEHKWRQVAGVRRTGRGLQRWQLEKPAEPSAARSPA